jgi:2-polyprenyl-3-methyl-5-hydroxy-6-metoxy-1,4-benzoquinol methylase
MNRTRLRDASGSGSASEVKQQEDEVAHSFPESCVLCGQNRFSSKYQLGDYRLIRCKHCRLLSIWPLPSREKIKELYDLSYRQGTRPFNELYFARHRKIEQGLRRLEEIEKHVPRGSILDVGSGFGAFLEAASMRGWDAQGLELSETSFKVSTEEFGMRVRNEELTEGSFPPSSFDAIALWNVLEHSPQPITMLKTAWTLLKNGGGIGIATPNAGSLAFRVLGRRWPMLIPPAHLHIFSCENLSRAVEEAGFHVCSMRMIQEDSDNEFVLIAKHCLRMLCISALIPSLEERIDWRLRQLFQNRAALAMRHIYWKLMIGPEIELYAVKH